MFSLWKDGKSRETLQNVVQNQGLSSQLPL